MKLFQNAKRPPFHRGHYFMTHRHVS